MSIDKEKSYNKETKRVFTSRSEPTLLYMLMSLKMRKCKNSADVFHRHHVHGKYVFQKFADKRNKYRVLSYCFDVDL